MKKKLKLDELEVESFEVDPAGLVQGRTVNAYQESAGQPQTHCDTVCPSHYRTGCYTCANETCNSCPTVCLSNCATDPCWTCGATYTDCPECLGV